MSDYNEIKIEYLHKMADEKIIEDVAELNNIIKDRLKLLIRSITMELSLADMFALCNYKNHTFLTPFEKVLIEYAENADKCLKILNKEE